MSSENNPNANSSATTSATAPTKGAPGTKQGDKPKGPAEQAADREKAPEADYLTRQQTDARAANTAVIGDMKRAAAQGADVREWTRLHPWAMVGGAAVAGLAAGLILMPGKSKKHQADNAVEDFFGQHWEAIRNKLNGLSPAGAAAAAAAATAATSTAAAQAQAAEAQPAGKSFLGNLVGEVLKVVGPTIGGIVSGAFAGNAQADDDKPHDGNGHANPQSYGTPDPAANV
jgi:hypothetical protein